MKSNKEILDSRRIFKMVDQEGRIITANTVLQVIRERRKIGKIINERE